MTKALYIRSRNADEPPYEAYRMAAIELETVHVSQLPDGPVPLEYGLIIIPMQTDEVMLARKTAWLEDALGQGVAVLANDIVARPYLSFLKPFEPIPLPGARDYAIRQHTPHPAFDGLPIDTFHLRDGMAGVYGVGHNPPPANAVVVNTIGHGAYAIDWYLRTPGGGLFFNHGGSDISAFHSDPHHMPNLTHSLIDWMLGETR